MVKKGIQLIKAAKKGERVGGCSFSFRVDGGISFANIHKKVLYPFTENFLIVSKILSNLNVKSLVRFIQSNYKLSVHVCTRLNLILYALKITINTPWKS